MRRLLLWSAPAWFGLLAAAALLLSCCRPLDNWDLIGYLGAAQAFVEQDMAALHAGTYAQLRQALPAPAYRELVAGDPDRAYSMAISTDVSAFKEQLPFYQIRPFYNGLILICHKAGVNMVLAVRLISGISVATAMVLLYLMCAATLTRPVIYGLPVFAVGFGMLDLARLATPDALAFLATVLSVYLFQQKRPGALLLLLPVTLGVRPDLILLALPLLGSIVVLERGFRWPAVLSMLGCLAIYVGIGRHWHNPGWAAIFYHTLVARTTHPISVPATLTAQVYVHALGDGLRSLASRKTFLLFCPVAAGLLCLTVRQVWRASLAAALRSRPVVLAAICLIYIAGHFLAFPSADKRFFCGAYLMSAFALLLMLEEILQARRAAVRPSPGSVSLTSAGRPANMCHHE